ncbi:hypothetical protein [Kocuria marina]|uniref:hypothetical protein n=1 Tax=Kocuria marina TaxID=223184 RepID=UPI0011A95655|nr:hypothetical protein [Kocuria indica]
MRTLVLHAGDHTAGPYGIDLLPGPGFPVTGIRPRVAGCHGSCGTSWSTGPTRWWTCPQGRARGAERELVLGLLEPVTALAAQLKRRDVPPYAGTPLVMISCWLAEWIRRADPDRRRALVRRFSALDLILTLSRNQIDILVDAGFRADQVAAIPFGCAPELFTDDGTERAIDVLAAGFDHGRDYGTFFRGVRDLRTTVHVLCQDANLAGIRVPDNVVVHGVVPFDEYRAMLRHPAEPAARIAGTED